MVKKPLQTYLICTYCVILVGCGQSALDNNSSKAIEKSDATLKKIQETNTITIGFSDGYSPFSFISPEDNQPTGYAVQISQYISNQIKHQLNQPNLQIKYQQLDHDAVFDALRSNVIDFECGSHKNTGIPRLGITFSVGFFVATPKFLVNKMHTFQDYGSLKNKTVAVIKNSEYEKKLKHFIRQNNINTKIISTRATQLPALLKEKQVDAIFNDRVLLENLRLEMYNPDDWYIANLTDTYAVYACTIRKSDDGLKKIIDDSLIDLYANGQIYQLYNKWFTSPLPNSHINLNYSLSIQNAELFAKPYDTPVPDDIIEATHNISKAFNVDSK